MSELAVIAGGFIGVPVFVYIIARLIFAAFFFTKRQFQERDHEQGR